MFVKKLLTLWLIVMITALSCSRINHDIAVYSHQPVIPVLKNKERNRILQIKIDTRRLEEPVNVSVIELGLDGSDDLSDIESMSLWYKGSDSTGRSYPELAATVSNPGVVTRIKLTQVTDNPVADFYVTCNLSREADLHRGISVRCRKITFADGSYVIPCGDTIRVKQRIGIAVRDHMDDNVHTYRIPGLTTTVNGTLLAVYDIRRESSRDLQGDIDIGVSRSTDGGNTWIHGKPALDMGRWGNLPEKFNGVSDPCILADRVSGKIFIAGLWMHGVLDDDGRWTEKLDENSDAWNHQWRNRGSQPGYGVKQSSQFIITSSADDGITWSEPENITMMCKKEEWWLLAPAPGHGISLDDGTLVFPTQGRDSNGKAFSDITYSTDRGKTWHTGNPAFYNTNENMVAQLSDGTIMLNARYRGNHENVSDTNGRVVVVTDNMGETWSEHHTSRSVLPEPVCMASLHKHVYNEDGKEKSILLFSNPDSRSDRHHLTLKVSFDDGERWPDTCRILLDEEKSRGYSCITSIDEKTIGILYESSQADLVFESIPLTEITDKKQESKRGIPVNMRE